MDYSVICQIKNWARHMARGDDAGVGYPSSSPSCREYRPPAGDTWEATPIRPYEDDAERMDRIIMGMPVTLISAVRISYLGVGTLTDRLRREQIPARTHYNRIATAHNWIRDKLDNGANACNTI